MRTAGLQLCACLLLLGAASALQEGGEGAELRSGMAAAAAAGGAVAAPRQQPQQPAQPAAAANASHEAAEQRQEWRRGSEPHWTLEPQGPRTAWSPFLHPLAPVQQQRSKQEADKAHADMQRYLVNFFGSSASQLTSTRLREAREAAIAVGNLSMVGPPQAAAERQPADAASASDPAVPQAEQPKEPPGPVFIPVPAGPQGGVPCGAACSRAAAKQVLLAREQPGEAQPLLWPAFREDPQRWAAWRAASQPGACLPRQPSERLTRDYLLVVAAGDDLSSIHSWLEQPDSATFDFVLLHYGADTELGCPRCAAVFHAPGPKWTLIWQLTRHPAWRQLSAGKRAIMIADDDLVLNTCKINRAFEVFSAYGLLLGQPSLCPTAHRPSWYLHLVQQPNSTLRFVTMVEIMAPIFETGFFQDFVRPSLHDAYTGWGLDFVWPFLLQYPRDRIGVIDDVCMLHPHSAQSKAGKGNSIYDALARVAPYDAREEEARRDAQFDYYPSTVAALGFPYRPLEVVGKVPPQPPPSPPFMPPPSDAASQPADLLLHQQPAAVAQAAASQQRAQPSLQQLAGTPPLAAASAGPAEAEHLPRGGIAHLLQPWLLYGQFSLIFAAVALLIACTRQRRPASPRRVPGSPGPGLPLHNGKAHRSPLPH